MVMVDTSVWVSHLKGGERLLKDLLQHTQALCHDFIIGELACGNLRNRREILALLEALPRAPVAGQEEVLYFIEEHFLVGSGIGFVDAHLLTSARLAGVRLWTLDGRLKDAAAKLALSYR